MRIPCPFCGERSSSEFTYHGATVADCHNAMMAESEMVLIEAVYLRDNPRGPHQELWYHTFGCQSWLKVTRNTQTHELLSASLVKERAQA